MGHLNIKKIIKVLKSIGYDGYLTVEVILRPSVKITVEKAVKFLRPLTK